MINTLAAAAGLMVATVAQAAAPPQKPAPAPAAAPKQLTRADFIKSVDARFSAIDANHDGKLSKEEMAAEQQKELAQANQRVRQATEAKFHQLDTNHDGVLSLQEFMALAPPVHTTETPDQIFARLDTNHDGKITPDEFRAPDLAKFNKIDANHDGVITPAEMQAAAQGQH